MTGPREARMGPAVSTNHRKGSPDQGYRQGGNECHGEPDDAPCPYLLLSVRSWPSPTNYELLSSGASASTGSFMELLGRCIYASRVLRKSLAPYYTVLKFARR